MRRAASLPHPGDAGENERIWAQVEASPEFRNASVVLAYMSVPGEVPTREFLEKWRGRKRFVLPKVSGDTLFLKEYSPELLVKGYMGIEEPSDSAPDVDPSLIDLALIPGVAFDSSGNRLGHGKGFYDRLLPALRCPVFGLCFSWRLVDSVPVSENDFRADRVVTAL